MGRHPAYYELQAFRTRRPQTMQDWALLREDKLWQILKNAGQRVDRSRWDAVKEQIGKKGLSRKDLVDPHPMTNVPLVSGRYPPSNGHRPQPTAPVPAASPAPALKPKRTRSKKRPAPTTQAPAPRASVFSVFEGIGGKLMRLSEKGFPNLDTVELRAACLRKIDLAIQRSANSPETPFVVFTDGSGDTAWWDIEEKDFDRSGTDLCEITGQRIEFLPVFTKGL